MYNNNAGLFGQNYSPTFTNVNPNQINFSTASSGNLPQDFFNRPDFSSIAGSTIAKYVPKASADTTPTRDYQGVADFQNYIAGYHGNGSFGDPAHPDLTNPSKRSDYDSYMAAQRAQQEAANRENQIRGDISSGWDSYTNQLNDILNNGLSEQRTAQENIANSQYGAGVDQLGLQKTQGLQDLGQQRTNVENNQTKSLRDLSGNLRNSFQAGNIYLGSRGAGDSSAANQYSYALTKMGNQQRSDIMQNGANNLSQIGARETNLNNIYNSQVNQLASQRDQQIQQVATWFDNAQNQLKQEIAQGGLNKSQDLANLSKDILNQGIARMNQANQQYQGQLGALQTWAMNHSNDINSLKSNLQQISQFAPQLPGSSPIAGTPQVDSQGNFNVPAGYGGGSSTQKKDIFGNVIG